MSAFDRLLNTVRLKDDYDEDFYDEEEDFDDEEDLKDSKVNPRFTQKIADDDLDEDDEPVKPKKKRFGKDKSAKAEKASKAEKQETSAFSGRSSKITPIKKAGAVSMEVCVIKPTSMEETKEIVDTLRDNCTVVLNLEGLDVETAQRIIDFVSGASFAIDGALRMVSSFIFILTPYGVEITGDIQDILGDAVPNIRTEF